jgi:hypothetical protein
VVVALVMVSQSFRLVTSPEQTYNQLVLVAEQDDLQEQGVLLRVPSMELDGVSIGCKVKATHDAITYH